MNLDPLPQNQWNRRKADHLLSRLAFLGSPEERETFYQLGRDSGVAAAVDSLIDPVTDWTTWPFHDWLATEAQGSLRIMPTSTLTAPTHAGFMIS